MSPRLSNRKLLLIGVIAFILVIFVYFETKQPTTSPEVKINIVNFDFDNGAPSLSENQNTPFNQTVKGITAHFASPSDPDAFSIQSDKITSLKLWRFSGNFLETKNQSRVLLDIQFNAEMVAINVTFATVELQNENLTKSSKISLLAYEDIKLVGTTDAYGSFSSDSYPQGNLSLSTGKPFNRVRITVPAETSTTGFLIDNIIVTSVSTP